MSSNSDSNDEQSDVSISNTDSGSELEYESDENCMYGNEPEYTREELLEMGEATDDFADSEDSDADSSLLDNSRLENLHWCSCTNTCMKVKFRVRTVKGVGVK